LENFRGQLEGDAPNPYYLRHLRDAFGRRFFPVFLAVYGRQEGVIEANPVSRRGVLDRELREI
jgi:hypothetical protein